MKYNLPVSIYSSDKVILDHDYIFIYRKSDGFSRRLLRADLIVSKAYQYELQLKSLEYQPSTGKAFSIFISGNLPTNLREKIEYLTSIKQIKEKIKHGYGGYIDDMGENTIILKKDKKIIKTAIHILDVEKFKKTANPAEKELMELHDMLHEWIEKIYKNCKEL